jgi:hypothetical protein
MWLSEQASSTLLHTPSETLPYSASGMISNIRISLH